MNKYKILLVVRHSVGGIRTFLRYFYRNFDSERYHFTLVSPDTPETRVLLDDLRKLDLVYIPTERDVSNRRLFQIVTEIIRNEGFDLIHSHGFTSGVCAVFGALSSRTAHILTCHDVFTERQFFGIKGSLKKIALAIMLSTVNCIHCVSHDARQNLLEYLPILRCFKRKIIAIPNGIEVERFLTAEKRDFRLELGLPTDSFIIGFMGRFMSQKGFRYLVEAFAEIRSLEGLSKRPVLLTFGEDGFMREERNEVNRRGLGDAVYFLPFVADAASTLKGLDVLTVPSLWEACPLLPMEALVAGVPVIGTNCVGLREVLKDTPAVVVPARDTAALKNALVSEMANPSTTRATHFVKEAATRFQVKERALELETLMRKFLDR